MVCHMKTDADRMIFLNLVQNPQNMNIRYEFSRWNKAGGTVLAGLVRRRKAEAELYFS